MVFRGEQLKEELIMERLTKRQREILEYIVGYINQRGFPPTLKEIGANFGISSTNAVSDHLKALIKKGYLRRRAGKSRAMDITAGFPGSSQIPLLGAIAAGPTLYAEENFQEFINLDDLFQEKGEIFALRVKGDSMRGVGILNGDLVIVKSQPRVENGEIGVISLDGEATVKRIFMEGRGIRLQPENEAYQPIFLPGDDPRLRIGGKVIGVIRRV